MGNEELLDVLPWSKTSQYTQQPRHAWDSGVDNSLKINYAAGRPDGYVKTFENLSYLKVIEVSMVSCFRIQLCLSCAASLHFFQLLIGGMITKIVWS